MFTCCYRSLASFPAQHYHCHDSSAEGYPGHRLPERVVDPEEPYEQKNDCREARRHQGIRESISMGELSRQDKREADEGSRRDGNQPKQLWDLPQ